MPYSKRTCDACSRSFRPQSIADGSTCRSCVQFQKRQEAIALPLALKDCEVCAKGFSSRDGEKRCPECRRLANTNRTAPVVEAHEFSAPLKQVVFDLETWGLERGWGVLLMGVLAVIDNGKATVHEFDLTQSKSWPARRSDDSELAEKILDVLRPCHVAFAHNGAWFDIPWLNSLALKYNLPPLRIKLIDPVQIARRKYRIGNNSLGAIANFLGLGERKMPLPEDVWRQALLDNDPESWELLRERCRSDVRILSQVAGHVVRDVGLIDYSGSAYR